MLANLLYRFYLNPGEKILYAAHTHPVTVYKRFIKTVFLGGFLPYFAYQLMPPLWGLWAAWGGIGALKLMELFLDWYFDALLVTNQSLIDLQWEGIFHRSATRIEYQHIEGVSYEVNGFFATILNYGDLTIERIGSGKTIGLKKVSFPKTVEREILQAQNEFVRDKSFRDHRTLQELIANMVQDYSNFK